MSSLDPTVLAAWDLSAWLHEPEPPASVGDLDSAERAIGRRLPGALRDLYLRHDGGSWLGGDLAVLPLLSGGDHSLARASSALRGWEWPVPEEVVVFGGDGKGSLFGVWLPRSAARPVVVQVGEIFEPGCMGVVGEDLNGFLRAWTAYYLQPYDEEDDVGPARDALGLPERLRSDDPDDELFASVFEWANPSLPASLSDPYEARLTADDVRRIAEA